MKELFTGDNGKLSSKRIIGTIILIVAMLVFLDAHFSNRDLNDAAFSTVLYTGGIMIVGGVLEGFASGKSGKNRSFRRSSLNEREGHDSDYGNED